MKHLVFSKRHKLALLGEELLAAFPQWVKMDAQGRRYTEVKIIGGIDDTIELEVPDDVDEAQIATIIDAHDADGVSISEQLEEEDRETRAHALTSVLGSMTPDEGAAWVEANVTDLASAKQALKLMAKILVVLIRELKKRAD